MNRPLIIILILLFLAILFLGARYIFQNFCGVTPPVAAATASNGIWAFDDGESFDAESNQYYRFKRETSKFIPGTTESFKSTIGSTVDYLKKNSARALTVTGLYSATESYSGNAGNLGLARANDIKASLVTQGVPAGQIVTEARILREDLFRKDTLQRGAYFTFYPTSGKTNAVAQSATSYMAGKAVVNTKKVVGANLVGKDMVIYFQTNKDELNLTSQNRKDMKDIKAYLDATPSARLRVSGHTDKRGDAAYNKRLSRGRAQFASEQLTKRYGISANKMNVAGFGEERPIDNANNEAAYKKNRRVEIRLEEK